MPFLHTDMTQVVKTIPPVRQELTYSTYSISWVLMTWRREEPWHQQPRYSLYYNGIIQSPHVKGKHQQTLSPHEHVL